MDSGFEYALNEYFRIKGCLLQWKGYLKSQSSMPLWMLQQIDSTELNFKLFNF